MHCRAMFWDAPSSVKRQFSSTRGGAAGAENLMKFTLKDGAVTRGLFDGLQTLRPGQRAAITCSPERAYGEAGMPPFVPPNAYVIYDIEVVSRHASAEDALASMGPGGIGDGGGSGAGGAGGGAPRTARAPRSSSAGRASTTGPTTPSSRGGQRASSWCARARRGWASPRPCSRRPPSSSTLPRTTNRTGRKKKRKRRRMREEREALHEASSCIFSSIFIS